MIARPFHETDLLVRALTDPCKQRPLDLLHSHDGATLDELSECTHRASVFRLWSRTA